MDSLIAVNGMVQNTCIISRELVDSTFRNQRVILESKQKQEKNLEISKNVECIKKQIKLLKQEKREKFLKNEKKKRYIQKKKAETALYLSKIMELDHLAFSISRYSIYGQPIPDDIMDKCRFEIKNNEISNRMC